MTEALATTMIHTNAISSSSSPPIPTPMIQPAISPLIPTPMPQLAIPPIQPAISPIPTPMLPTTENIYTEGSSEKI